ncbi:MAG: hypothetical protein OSB82_15920, partial [Alphaproteobacteria bacterium]|nr:hypothetical protein [Alphaproteobacteria bacterium]
MVQTATKPPAEADTANDRLQVREVVNAAKREKILRFRDRIMVEERGVEPDAMSRREQLDQAARDEAARHLFLTSGKAIADCLRSYTAEQIPPSDEMNAVYEPSVLADFDPAYRCFTDHMVIGDRWRGSQAPALMTVAAFKLARSCGAHFDFTYCPPALVGLYEKIGCRSYSG